jgi:hypothetical protein
MFDYFLFQENDDGLPFLQCQSCEWSLNDEELYGSYLTEIIKKCEIHWEFNHKAPG